MCSKTNLGFKVDAFTTVSHTCKVLKIKVQMTCEPCILENEHLKYMKAFTEI